MPTLLYELQEGESAKAFAAFCLYRDAGPAGRSVDAVSLPQGRQNSGKRAAGIFWRWAALHEWKRRAEAFDADQDRKHRDAVDAAQREEIKRFQLHLRRDNERFAEAARVSLGKALASLQKLSEETLSARDACALLHAASGAIRVANEIQAQSLGLDALVGLLDDDPLDQRDDGEFADV